MMIQGPEVFNNVTSSKWIWSTLVEVITRALEAAYLGPLGSAYVTAFGQQVP